MKKFLIAAGILLATFAGLQSFSIVNHNNKKDEKAFLPIFKNKTVTASDNTVIRVGFSIDPGTGDILLLRVFLDSNCNEVSYVGYTGNVYLSGGSWYANNITIDLNGTDNAVVNGLLSNGLTGCEVE
jgi:hypothetical protein